MLLFLHSYNARKFKAKGDILQKLLFKDYNKRLVGTRSYTSHLMTSLALKFTYKPRPREHNL